MKNEKEFYIALVGKNPLPVYISGLNYLRKNTRVYFIYTKNEENSVVSSKKITENICEALTKKVDLAVEPILMGCAKSNYLDLQEKLSEIKKTIEKENEIISNEVTVYVDYTGATKMMAAGVYRFFKECDKELENVKFRTIYVSSGKEIIYENGFFNGMYDGSRCFSNEEISQKYNISYDDILELHGWHLKKSEDKLYITRQNVEGSTAPLASIECNGFNLTFGFDIHAKKINELTKQYFYICDLCEKAGGSMANIILYVDNDKIVEASEEFYNKINNISNADIREKVKIRSVN